MHPISFDELISRLNYLAKGNANSQMYESLFNQLNPALYILINDRLNKRSPSESHPIVLLLREMPSNMGGILINALGNHIHSQISHRRDLEHVLVRLNQDGQFMLLNLFGKKLGELIKTKDDFSQLMAALQLQLLFKIDSKSLKECAVKIVDQYKSKLSIDVCHVLIKAATLAYSEVCQSGHSMFSRTKDDKHNAALQLLSFEEGQIDKRELEKRVGSVLHKGTLALLLKAW